MESPRVLIVDDHSDSAKMLSMLLELEGFIVKTAGDGPPALHLALEWSPHAILLDLTLPTMSGQEVARRLRGDAQTKNCVLLATSGRSIDDPETAALFDKHFLKPIDSDHLSPVLKKLVEERFGAS